MMRVPQKPPEIVAFRPAAHGVSSTGCLAGLTLIDDARASETPGDCCISARHELACSQGAASLAGVLYFFFRCGIFFLEVVFFFGSKQIIRPKKYCAPKKNTQTFFSARSNFFLTRMPQMLEVIKKVSGAIPWVFVGERGACGDRVTARGL